ncbi:MAG: hypothetical protein AAFO29_06200 [Actinomycetota bacterium]
MVFGLPIFLVLAGVLTWWSVNRIEAKVETDLRADLAEAGVDPDEVAIDVDYRDASIEGLVDGPLDVESVESAADEALLRDLDVDDLQRAPIEEDPAAADQQDVATGPVRINVVYDGLTLRLSGTVLNEGQHNVVLETIDLLTGRAEIQGELTISRLAPAVDGVDDRIADLVTAVESMDLADEWAIRLTDRGLAIEATVTDPEAAAAVGALDRVLTATPTTIEVTDPNAVEEA